LLGSEVAAQATWPSGAIARRQRGDVDGYSRFVVAALGVQAEVAGTMNNLTFGNEHRQYYETIGSESGAGDGFGRVGRTDPHDQLAPH
jgi:N-methylhydantoinase B/oxoprolinase/acetone carboxylase alpha subunit